MTLPFRSEMEQKLARFEGCTPGPYHVGELIAGRLQVKHGDEVFCIVLALPGKVMLGESRANLIVQAMNAQILVPQLVEWVRELMDENERLRSRATSNSTADDTSEDVARQLIALADAHGRGKSEINPHTVGELLLQRAGAILRSQKKLKLAD